MLAKPAVLIQDGGQLLPPVDTDHDLVAAFTIDMHFSQDLDSILAGADQGLANFKALIDAYRRSVARRTGLSHPGRARSISSTKGDLGMSVK